MKKNRTIIIAEAGVNHNGKLNIAKKLITAAAVSGADYVKFQTFVAENIVRKNQKLFSYQKLYKVNMQKLYSLVEMLFLR